MRSDPASRLVAVCDACALYSITMADLLTSLGEAGLFHPRWTNEIHDEWIRNLIENRGASGTLTREKLEARRDAMIEAIEGSLVEDYEDLSQPNCFERSRKRSSPLSERCGRGENAPDQRRRLPRATGTTRIESVCCGDAKRRCPDMMAAFLLFAFRLKMS